MTELRIDAITAVCCIVVGGALALQARSFPDLSGYPGPGLFPVIIGALLAVTGLLLLARATYRSRRWGMQAPAATTPLEDGEEATPRGRALLNASAVLLAIPVYMVLAPRLGFLVTVGIVSFGLMQVLRVRVVQAVLVSVGLTAVVTYLFGEVLSVNLPTSSLW